jgi:hypothetical protein
MIVLWMVSIQMTAIIHDELPLRGRHDGELERRPHPWVVSDFYSVEIPGWRFRSAPERIDRDTAPLCMLCHRREVYLTRDARAGALQRSGPAPQTELSLADLALRHRR